MPILTHFTTAFDLLSRFIILSSSLSQDNVTGVLISDKEGLCVGYKGTIHPSNSARLTNIFEAALKMAPEQIVEAEDGTPMHIPEQPLVIIDTNHGQILTSYLDGFCTTITKTVPSNVTSP